VTQQNLWERGQRLSYMFVMIWIFSSIYVQTCNMAGKRKFTKKEVDYIIQEYNNKKTITQIINECGFKISRSTIYTLLNENGVNIERKQKPKNDLTGMRFGYLEVIKMAQTEKSGDANEWRAICYCYNCGNKNFDVHPQSLLRNRTKSCGCSKDQYIKMSGENSKLYKGCGEISGKLWWTIKNRANRRNYNINISIEYVWNLYLKQNGKCALSGMPIHFANANKKNLDITASLDRIDSNQGYVEDNVQWVHKNVNIMKNIFNQQYFIHLCKEIAKNNK
jgi:hypothetical protein